MKQFLSRIGIVCVLAVLAVAFVGSSIPAAEEKKISGNKITKRVISRNTSYPGDNPKHVMDLIVREDTITSTDQEWNNVEAFTYEQSDHYAGTGWHRGYLILRHKNGDESYLKYQGIDTTVATERGAWEVSSEGELQIAGGTGKFKDLKGSGRYKGKTTPIGSTVDWEVTIE